MQDGAGDAVDTMIFTLKKCPDEPGEWKQGSTECLPWRVMQGLQRNVIGMALCCKKGGGQSIIGATATAKTTRITWYCRITVLRRDWVVVA
jgi:hypothetical protein